MMLIKNFKNEILFYKKRFILYTILISIIIGILTGLNALEKDINLSSKIKYKKHNIMDIKVSSDVGFNKSDYNIINKIDKTNNIMFINKLNCTIKVKNNKANAVLISYDNSNHINKHRLKYGRYPYTINEAVVEEIFFNKYRLALGNLITVEDSNKILKAKKLKIVGVIEKSDYHLLDDNNVNNSNIILVYSNNFSRKYYTNIYITVDKKKDEEYNSLITNYIHKLNDSLNPVINKRFKEEKESITNELNLYQEDLNELYNLDLPQESLNNDIKLATDNIQKAKDKLSMLNNPNIHILRRSNTIGYKLTYTIINKYKKVDVFLPLLFIIGILIVIIYESTILIDDDKTEIETLKSLGYNSSQIALKYILYNFTIILLSSIIGAVIINRIIRIFILKKLNLLQSILKLTASFNTKTILELLLIIILVLIASFIVYFISNKKEELN